MALRLVKHLQSSKFLFKKAQTLPFFGSSSSLENSSLRLFHVSYLNQYADPIQLKMPALSPTMTEGQIVKWHKKEGDSISPGDILFEVQTDKAVMGFEIEEEGVIAKILPFDESKPIKVGSLVALMVGPGEDWKNAKVSGIISNATNNESTPSASANQAQVQSSSHHDKLIGPAARNLINLYKIDTSKIQPSGPHAYIEKNHLVVESDEVNTQKNQVLTTPPSKTEAKKSGSIKSSESTLDYEDIELSNMRKVIAKRLIFSKTTVPHSYATSHFIVDKIASIRKEMIKNNQKVSINDFIIKAIALALRLVPELNSNYDEQTKSFKSLSTVDVSVAVATENGLITPIVKNADKLSVLEISEAVKNLADKARKNKLQPHEFQGGSFSISNLGMFGIKEFTAVINPPQIGILAVGKSELKFNAELKEQNEVAISLSFDERCVPMDRAIKFLNTVNSFISNPELLDEPSQF